MLRKVYKNSFKYKTLWYDNLFKQNTIGWITQKQKRFIFHDFGDRKSKMLCAHREEGKTLF